MVQHLASWHGTLRHDPTESSEHTLLRHGGLPVATWAARAAYCSTAQRTATRRDIAVIATQDYISRLNSELEYLKRKFVIESKFKQKQEG